MTNCKYNYVCRILNNKCKLFRLIFENFDLRKKYFLYIQTINLFYLINYLNMKIYHFLKNKYNHTRKKLLNIYLYKIKLLNIYLYKIIVFFSHTLNQC